jgi:phosphoribosylglycinamide formyltransferase 1
MKVAVLASGEGTNLQALLDGVHGRDGIELVAVASDRPEARALERARAAGVATESFPLQSFAGRRERDRAMAEWLRGASAELVVLAGYMQLLSQEFLGAFPQRVINVHPALLPAFPGAHAIEDAIAHGVKVTGVTVHLVDAEHVAADTGPIVLQEPVSVSYDDTAADVADRLHRIEHRLLPEAVRLYGAGRIHVDGRRVRVSG